MLKFITVIVICYFGKLENSKSSIFGPATIFWTRDNLPATRDTRRLDYLVMALDEDGFLLAAFRKV